MIVMRATVIGGMSTEEGPIVGTAIVVFTLSARQICRNQSAYSGDNTHWHYVTRTAGYYGVYQEDPSVPINGTSSYWTMNSWQKLQKTE